jgi:hypothetical protein
VPLAIPRRGTPPASSINGTLFTGNSVLSPDNSYFDGGNWVWVEGGALYVKSAQAASGPMIVTNCSFVRNHARGRSLLSSLTVTGGAIKLFEGKLFPTSCYFANKTAQVLAMMMMRRRRRRRTAMMMMMGVCVNRS